MSTVAKIFAFVVAVAAIAFASAAFVMVQNTEDYKKLYETEQGLRKSDVDALNTKLQSKEKERADAEDRAKASEKLAEDHKAARGVAEDARKGLETALTAQQKRSDDLAANVATIKDDLNTLRAENKTLSDAKENLTKTTETATRAREKAEDDLRSCQEQLAMEQKKVEQLRKDLAEAQGVISAYQKEAPEVVHKKPVADMPDITGRVVRADNEKGIALISVGKDDAVKEGYTFEVFRPGQYVGRLVVMEVFPEQAICRIDPAMREVPVMENDNVATKLP